MVRGNLASFLAGLGCLALVSGPMAPASAEEKSPGPSLPSIQSLDQLAHLSWCELEQLYRQSPAGNIPDGYVQGRVVYCPAEPLAGTRARVTRLVWHGKHLCATEGIMINQWLGVRAIRARITYGPSWLDGKTSIILDYRDESRVWSDVRDEMREVAPGLYVGAMYLSRCPQPHLKLFFCLAAPCR